MRLTSKKYPRGTRVGGIVLSKDKAKVAVIERNRDSRHYFVFPGGGAEDFDKSILDTLRREMKEEIGVDVFNERKMYTLLITGHGRQLFFICETENENLQLTGEEVAKNSAIDQYKPVWVNISEISSLPLFPIEIRDWLVEDFKKGVFVPREQKFESIESMKKQ